MFSRNYLMDIKINLETLKDLENENIKVDAIKFQKMLFFIKEIVKKSRNFLKNSSQPFCIC